jgi:hypothetical protein
MTRVECSEDRRDMTEGRGPQESIMKDEVLELGK